MNERIGIVKNNIKNARYEIANDLDSYIDYLRVIAFNYKFNSNLQSNIFAQCRHATACTTYEQWVKKYNRIPIKGSKGIGYIITDFKSNKQYLNYVFDISQTKGKNGTSPVKIWEYDENKHISIFDTLIQESGGDNGLEDLSILDKLAFNYSNAEGLNFIEKHQLQDEEKREYYNFLVESVKIITNFRLKLDYEYNFENLKYHQMLKENTRLTDNVLNSLSYVAKELIGDIIKMGNEIDIKIEKELENEKINNKQSEVYRREWNIDTSQSNRTSREIGNEVSTSGNGRGENTSFNTLSRVGSTGERDGRIIAEQVGINEEKLSNREREGIPGISVVTELNSELSVEYANRDRELEDSLQITESTSGHTDFRGDDSEPIYQSADNQDGLGLDNSKDEIDNPNILINKKILDSVPNIYSQEKVANADKTVYAAFFIPFRSSWTWYMCEYDPETKNAYGLVLGEEAEWGYFNINELEELNAQRLILEDFPKTFRELKDTELKKQMSEEELYFAFNGEISFDDNTNYEPNKEVNLANDNEIISLEEIRDSYNDFISREYDSEPLSQETFENIKLLDVCYTDGLGDTEEYELQIQYDLENFKELITVTGKNIVAFKEYDVDLKEFKNNLNNEFDDYIAQDNTGIHYEDLDELQKLVNNKELSKYYDKIAKLGYSVTWTDELLHKYEEELNSEKESGMNHAKEENINFILSDEIDYLPSERINNNIEAIRLVKKLDSENRNATKEEKEILSKFVGWGGLSEVFDERKTGQWAIARNEIKSLLNKEEYTSAVESTLSAFYTPQSIIKGIYETLDRIGLKNGSVLEPSCGIGKFIGYSDNRYKFTGIELDSITGKIAKYLYPESNICISGYEKVDILNDSFDAAISNIPFGDFKVFDENYNKNNFLIHDYYFEKTIDKVRVGGVIAFITSSGTMDKENISIRKYISERCELLGAIRLDNKTFSGNANTAVTTDIIFLQKREQLEKNIDDWVYLKTDENGLRYNSYYVDNPEMVTGNIEVKTNKFGRNIIVCSRTDDYNEKLQNAFSKIKVLNNFGMIHAEEKEAPIIIKNNVTHEQYSYVIVDDKVFYNNNNELVEQKFNIKDINRVIDYIQIKEVLKNIINVQLESDDNSKLNILQSELRSLHSSYISKYGLLNVGKNERILEQDNDYYLVSSIEILDKDKNLVGLSDIAYNRTINKKIEITHSDNPSEALIYSLTEKGKVDITFIQNLLNKSKKETIDLLQGQIFLDINQTSIEPMINEVDFYLENNSEFKYVTYDEYLTGDIREKIKCVNSWIEHYEVEGEAEIVEKLMHQKRALVNVLPKDLDASEISIELGATWIDDKYIQQFVHELFESGHWAKRDVRVTYVEELDKWNISNKTQYGYGTMLRHTYGTKRVNGFELLEKILNLSTIEVYDTFEEDGKKERVLNKQETLLANQKADMIRLEFKRWIFNDIDRRKYLVDKYNRLFNGFVKRNYDGSHLSFNGINENIKLRDYQKNAIARTLYGKNTLLAHTVGAGKTFTMIASGMEAKRMGLSNKPMYVVPKAVNKQFAQSFMKLYPTANLLVVKEKDLTKENRRYFVGKMATGNYDGIILTHEQFGKIELSVEFQNEFIERKLDELQFMEDSLSTLDRNRRNFSIKEIQQRKKSLQAKLESNIARMGKDDTIPFEKLGVDRIYVDEAHMFKNLGVETKSSKIAGINRTSSLRAVDMKMKCDYINSLENGRIIFATGTAISNSMTELYTMQSYLQSDTLSNKKILSFDAWASTFGVITRKLELKPEGNGFQIKGRFAKFHNIPELLNLFGEIADIQTADMLNLPTPEANYEVIITEASETQKMILESISKRADNIRDNLVDPTEDNMLKLTGDGKKLALDQRLINELLPDDEKSKVNKCVSKAFEIAENTKEDKLTQIIFCDMSTPNKDKFNVYDDIKNKLINKGMNENEIAFIHDYDTEIKRAKLFELVQKGDVRIVLGSTQKLGTGVNIQDKLIAIHDLDVPWRPSDLEQRSGRIIRQGNTNEEVFIYRYVTEGTFDSYLWQTLENKQKFISQIITSKTPARVINETDELSLDYSEIKALATGNPLIKEKMVLENEIANLYMLETSHRNSQQDLETKVKEEYPTKIFTTTRRLEKLKDDIKSVEPVTDDFKIVLNGKTFEDKKEAGKYLLILLTELVTGERKREIGVYRGFNLSVEYEPYTNFYMYSLEKNGIYRGELGSDALGNLTRINNTLDSLEKKVPILEEELATLNNSFESAKNSLGKPFEQAEELKQKILRLAEVDQELNLSEKKKETTFDNYVEEYEMGM
ncbi:MAG: SNF2-related protein [Erysipelotrichaceae bacterium]|nr:SNF2-related protein [Erysipelotrichaceae bacterium]